MKRNLSLKHIPFIISINTSYLQQLKNPPKTQKNHYFNLTLNPSFDNLHLLNYGPKHIPHPTKQITTPQLDYGFKRLIRNIQWSDFWSNQKQPYIPSPFDPRLIGPPSKATPPDPTPPTQQLIDRLNMLFQITSSFPMQIHSSHILKTCKQLKNNPTIKITSADKNLGLCILPTSQYNDFCTNHLSNTSNFLPISDLQMETIKTELKSTTNGLITRISSEFLFPNNFIRRQSISFISVIKDLTPKFHILPKLHSTPISSRPIIGAHSWITTNLSKWLNIILQELPLQSVLKNTTDLIHKIEGLQVSNATKLVTFDITALYPNIDLPLLFHICSLSLSPLTVEIIQHVCTNMYCSFENQYYKQLNGIAMGDNSAPTLANIYLSHLIDPFLRQNCFFYGRYLDDLILLTNASDSELQTLTTKLNNIHPKLKFKLNYSTTSIAFLDVLIYKSPTNTIHFNIYQKSLHQFRYLSPYSFHPPSTMKGWIKAELIRYSRNCTLESDYIHIKHLFAERLLKLGYNRTYLAKIFNSVPHSYRTLNKPPPSDNARIFPFIIPFNNTPINKLIQSLLPSLQKDLSTCLPNLETRLLIAYTKHPSLLKLLNNH
jgi:hypothetical protein